MNIFSKNYKALKQLVVYQPPEAPRPFVLKEVETPDTQPAAAGQLDTGLSLLEAQTRFARRLRNTLEKARALLAEPINQGEIAAIKVEIAALEAQKAELSLPLKAYSLANDPLEQAVSTSLEENKRLLGQIYNVPDNKDVIFREITIPASPPVSAMLVFIDGLVDNKTVNLSILQPLMLMGSEKRELYQGGAVEQVVAKYLPINQVKPARLIRKVTDGINLGETAIFFEGAAEAVTIETIGQEHRGVDRPATERSVFGSQSSFTETLRVNTGLVRSQLRASDLTTEMLTIGKRSNTTCALMYINSIANPALVQEARRRLSGIQVDSVSGSVALQKFIVDHPWIPYPQVLTTERPDRVAAALTEGRLAILVDGSPFAIVMPISVITMFHSGEDFAYTWSVASFSRIIRVAGLVMTTLLPALYIAISYYHQEAIPTDLIIAIGGARERVPFPSFVEIAIMEFAFELVREAGVRIPGILGPTIGIVGAITLGQAGIAAAVVSPITVVIIAITGLASFAIADYSFAAANRLIRFFMEVLAAFLGLVGIASGITLLLVILAGMKSLGVPYLAPVGPKTTTGYDVFLRGPLFSQELRPAELNPRDVRRQAPVSRAWTQEESIGKEDGE